MRGSGDGPGDGGGERIIERVRMRKSEGGKGEGEGEDTSASIEFGSDLCSIATSASMPPALTAALPLSTSTATVHSAWCVRVCGRVREFVRACVPSCAHAYVTVGAGGVRLCVCARIRLCVRDRGMTRGLIWGRKKLVAGDECKAGSNCE